MKSIITALLISVTAIAHASSCPQFYPEPLNVPNTVELCNTEYVVLYSTSRKAAILTSQRFNGGQRFGDIERDDNFRADPRLGLMSPRPNDYTRTGYDRGHMAAAGDMTTDRAMSESFYMTNMTPQAPQLNRGEWRKLEMAIRNYITRQPNTVFVVTIAEYSSPVDAPKENGITVPNGYWKFVYSNGSKQIYFARNENEAKVIRSSNVAIKSLIH